MNQRTCTGCTTPKALTDFYSKGKRLDSKCKACKLKDKRDKYAAEKVGQNDAAPIFATFASTVIERTCSRCDKTKPLPEFAKRDAKTYKKFCNDCWNATRRSASNLQSFDQLLKPIEVVASSHTTELASDFFEILSTNKFIVTKKPDNENVFDFNDYIESRNPILKILNEYTPKQEEKRHA